MENTKEEFSNKLEKVLHVYIFAQEVYLYTEYFHNPETKEELELITKSAHAKKLSMIRHIMFRTLVTEVSKLYSRSKNEKFRLEKLIESLSQSGDFKGTNIPEDRIQLWKQNLLENKETIDSILKLRNKVYAHTDDQVEDYSHVDISFKKIKILLDIADNILKGIHKQVFNIGLLTNPLTFDRKRFSLLKLLASAEKERQASIFNKYNSILEAKGHSRKK